MNQRRNAAIVIFCALVLAIGAYVILSPGPKPGPEVVQETIPPEPEPEPKPAKAPNWVDEGQNATPDYSSANAEPETTTPQAEPDKAATETPQEDQIKVIEVNEDDVVTYSFVEALADYVLLHFHPVTNQGTPATMVSAKTLNMRFGRDMTGFNVTAQDIDTARKSLLDYVFTPEKIKFLYRIYAPAFVAYLEDSAVADDREYIHGNGTQTRTLTPVEIGVMFRLNALKAEQAARIFRGIADDPSITKMAGEYLGAYNAVGRANVALQNAIAEEHDTAAASKRLKQAIMQREMLKESILQKLRKHCPYCSDADLFYIAQWSYRRMLNDVGKLPTFAVLADILEDLSKRFLKEAANLPQ